MKKCIDGTGSNQAAQLVAYLKAKNPIYTAELYQIQAARSDGTPFSQVIRLTDWSSPLIWSFAGVFDKAIIKHSPIACKIGLDAEEVTVDWSPGDLTAIAADGGSVPTIQIENYIQAFDEGLYDHGILRIWRTYMPEPGDSNSFGAVHVWEGRIGEPTTDSLGIHIKAATLMECLNRKLPPNLIERNNINAAWTKAPNSVQCLAQLNSTTTKLYFVEDGAPATLFPAGAFRHGHVEFVGPAGSGSSRPGELIGHYRAVQDSYVEDGVNVILLFDPLPFPPNVNAIVKGYAAGEPFTAYPPHPTSITSNDPAQTGYPQCQPFPFIPRPEDSI